jgi:4-amino-4-deoxy-L-arabinose transferase-like glycosyltransferase
VTIQDPHGGTTASHGRARLWLALLLLLIVAHLPALAHPRAIDDEQIYSVVAREMLHGGRPYLDVVERKPPLLFVVYAAVLGAAGPRNWFALHFTALAWTLTTMAGLYLIMRRRFDRETGAIAGLLYGLFAMWADFRSLALNGELLMNLPIVLALLVAFAPERPRWRPDLLLAGGLIGVGALLKQPAAIAGLALGLYVLSPWYRRSRGLGVADSLWHGSALTLGFAVVLALAGVVLWRLGILREALYWSILDHRDPIGPGTLHYWKRAAENTTFFLLETAPLLLGAAASFIPRVSRTTWGRYPAERWGVVVLLAVSVFGVSVNGQFLYHYYLQLLPPLCLLAAPVFRMALIEPVERTALLPGRRVLTGWLGLTLLLFTTVDTAGFWLHRRDTVAGRWVREHAAPEDRLFVWGQGDRVVGIFLDADRRPASRFIATFPLTGHVFGGYPPAWGRAYEDRNQMSGAWDTLRLDFAAHPPRFIVDASVVGSGVRYPLERYPILSQLVATSYRPAARTPDGIVYERLAP